MQHFISIAQTSVEDLNHVFDVAFELREQRRSGRGNDPVLAGKTLAMIFEKPSLRTRVSFEQAMYELGGHAIVLDQQGVGLGVRESVADVARVLGRMVQGVAARVFEHEKLIQLCEYCPAPVVNMLSDYSHPCQAMADMMTLMDDFGRDLAGRRIAFIGDGNNVARSLAVLSGKLGLKFVLASPPGFELEQELADKIMAQSPHPQFELTVTNDPHAAVAEADCIYTDTFTSMGQEREKEKRMVAFADYQVNAKLLAAASDQAVVLHCMPAYRGVEITDEVMDGPQSRCFAQAENRLHAQKGLLAVLMQNDPS